MAETAREAQVDAHGTGSSQLRRGDEADKLPVNATASKRNDEALLKPRDDAIVSEHEHIVDLHQQPLRSTTYADWSDSGLMMNLRRRRRAVTSLILSAWLLAFLVGFANACVTGTVNVAHAGCAFMGSAHDDGKGPAASCLQSCSDEAPTLAKLPLFQDHPSAQLVLVASVSFLQPPTPAPAAAAVRFQYPPPDVPARLRLHRLAL